MRIKLWKSDATPTGTSWPTPGVHPGWSDVTTALSQWSKAGGRGGFQRGQRSERLPLQRPDPGPRTPRATTRLSPGSIPSSSTGPPRRPRSPSRPPAAILAPPRSSRARREDRYCAAQRPYTCPGAGRRNYEGNAIVGSSVAVALFQWSYAKYWDGDGFDFSAPVWSTATSTWGTPAAPGPTTCRGRADLDSSSALHPCGCCAKSLGQHQVITTNTFTMDFPKPGSVVTLPEHGQTYSSLADIRGTSLDVGAARIKRVWAAYYRPPAPWGGGTRSARRSRCPTRRCPPDPPGAAKPPTTEWRWTPTTPSRSTGSQPGASSPDLHPRRHLPSPGRGRGQGRQYRGSPDHHQPGHEPRELHLRAAQPGVGSDQAPRGQPPSTPPASAAPSGTANAQANTVEISSRTSPIPQMSSAGAPLPSGPVGLVHRLQRWCRWRRRTACGPSRSGSRRLARPPQAYIRCSRRRSGSPRPPRRSQCTQLFIDNGNRP